MKKPNIYSWILLTKIKMILIVTLLCSVTSSLAQGDCTLDQSISIRQNIDDCGTNGILNVDLINGEAPYNINVRDFFTGESTSAVTSNDSFGIQLFPGTFEISTVDVNGCEDSTTFEIFANNFVIEELECLENGRRRVRFSNNSSSFIPVHAEIGSFGFSLARGTASILEVPSGTFTFKISRSGCTPYYLTFAVDSCPSNKSNVSNASIQRSIEIISESSNLESKVYPNPFKEDFTLDLGQTEKNRNATTIMIYNMDGKIVYKKLLNESKININLSHLNSGSYFVKAIDNKGVELFTQHVIKQ